jgi:proteic killer suppression protein
MIKSFGDRRTERLFADQVVKEHAAARLDDLRVPPSNRPEKLKGDRRAFHSIRINDQWPIVFRWSR